MVPLENNDSFGKEVPVKSYLLQYFLTYDGADHAVNIRDQFKSLPDEFISGKVESREYSEPSESSAAANAERLRSISKSVSNLIAVIKRRQESAAQAGRGNQNATQKLPPFV